ncbi:hypothetical protein EGW08_000729 [Elysia chlorotica]|uniref:Uncharacterized protein n=1 Tax=Elysia chlorotica TaxID=188477 RepID=A0A3S1AGM3_ELYCH|nr:hypothetical protein EGW08_000729 [Elysia chlorotica]
MSDMYYGYTYKQLRVFAYEMAVSNNIAIPQYWKDNKMVRINWQKGFVARNGEGLSSTSTRATVACASNKERYTKFSPDAGFGLLKRKFRRTRVDCLGDIKHVVDSSSEMNSAKLVGAESGPSQVLTYDWSSYLSQFFVKVKQVKSFHHFTMNNSGTIVVKEYNNTGEQQQVLLKKVGAAGAAESGDKNNDQISPRIGFKYWY